MTQFDDHAKIADGWIMHGERDERAQRNTDDEVTVEVNGEEAGLDPDRTRTIRFPPPKLSNGADRPPPPTPEPPPWRQPDGSDGPDRNLGHFATTPPPAEPGARNRPSGMPGERDRPATGIPGGPGQTSRRAAGLAGEAGEKRRPTVGPPPGPIQPPDPLMALNAFQAPSPLGAPAWQPATPDVPVFPPPQHAGHEPQRTGPDPLAPPTGRPEPMPAGLPEPVPTGTTAESLRPDRLLRTRRRPPAGGWRKAVFTLTGGLIRPKDSKAERHRQELIERVRQPVSQGHFRVAVMSLKGGVGKTTTTIGLGSTLAHHRGDRVIAVDANPDRGTLSEKLRVESPATVRHLLNDRAGLWRYADVRSYTSQAPSRLEVLASDRDPAISEAFNADDYRAVAQILEQFYSIAITDCGTGMLHSAMSAILDMADQIVLVSPVTVDGARSASATLDWLQAHGHQELAASAVVVLSAVKNPRRNAVNVAELKEHFTKRCRAVIGVPFDPHLEQGSEVDLDLLRTATRDMYLEVGATIADRFDPRAVS